jgi:hypothetical protein
MTETDGINPNITFLAVIESFAPGVPIAPHEGQAQLMPDTLLRHKLTKTEVRSHQK